MKIKRKYNVIFAKIMQRYSFYIVKGIIYRKLTLTLTHFELRVLLVDYEEATFTTHDFAVSCTLLD